MDQNFDHEKVNGLLEHRDKFSGKADDFAEQITRIQLKISPSAAERRK
jgi:hypothetical protein